MAVIETKYSIGDVVWHASMTQETKSHPCPDCKGERKWKAISPAGSEYEFTCPRCSSSFLRDRELSLNYPAYVATTCRLTIGSIHVDTAPFGDSSKTQYMCLETGVGGGSIYDESRLFASQEEALAAAEVMAIDANGTTAWIAKEYSRALKISDYELENAKIQMAKEAVSSANSKVWNLGYLFEEIEEATDKAEILERVESYKARDWADDKATISAELVAAEAMS